MDNPESPIVLLRWNSESSTLQYEEPDGYIYETSGDVHVVDDSDESQLAGKFKIYYVDVEGAVNHGEPLYDVLDAHSRATAEYFDPLFSPDDGTFNERVLELVDYEIVDANLLILDRLELLPQFRGHGLGLTIMQHMIRRFSSGAAIIALKAFPLQFEASCSVDNEHGWRTELGLDRLSKNEKSATAKLQEHYGRVGFIPVPNSAIMVRATAWALPAYDS